MSNYRRTWLEGGNYFYAVNLLKRHSNDLLARYIDMLRGVIRDVRVNPLFIIRCWVGLPDHVHCVIELPQDADIFASRWKLIKPIAANPAQIPLNKAGVSAPCELHLRERLRSFAVPFFLLASTPLCAESICYGTPSNGKIDDAAQLPSSGANFSAYSDVGIALGRTFVHTQVREIIVAAYRELEQASPETRFVYGETGWKNGGSFKPHRTHQNGLSVDFFVPVRDGTGRSVALPTNIATKFGYDIEFDSRAKFRDYTIDFDAISEHLYALDIAAKKRKAPIKLVIFEPAYLPKLFATKRGDYLKSNVRFMKSQAWVRHDEHYHVDFSMSCKSIRDVQTKK